MAKIAWDDDTLHMAGQPIELEALREMFRDVIKVLHDELRSLLFGEDPGNLPVPEHISDSWSSMATGYSFVTDSWNGIDSDLLLNRVIRRFAHMLEGHHRLVSDRGIATKWRDRYLQFLKLLAVVTHMLGGPPPHASEHLKSTINCQGLRDRYIKVWLHQQVVTIGRYHKTTQVSGGKLHPEFPKSFGLNFRRL